MNDTTIIIPALKNSPILDNSLEHCLRLKTKPNIIIVTDDIRNDNFDKYENVEYMVVTPGMTMSKKRNIAVKKCLRSAYIKIH